jgi:hypothetical protein
LQAVAMPPYLSRFLFYTLPRVTGCCAPGGVRVVSTGGNFHAFRTSSAGAPGSAAEEARSCVRRTLGQWPTPGLPCPAARPGCSCVASFFDDPSGDLRTFLPSYAREPRGLSVFRRSDPPQARRPGRFRLRPGDASARRLEAVLFSPLRFSRTSQPFPFFLLSCGFDMTAITGRKCLQSTSRRRRG